MLKKMTSILLSILLGAVTMTSCMNRDVEDSGADKSDEPITTEAETEEETTIVTTTKKKVKTTTTTITTTKKVTTTVTTTTAAPTEPPTEPPTDPPTEPPTQPPTEPEVIQISYRDKNELSVPDFAAYVYDKQLWDITKDRDAYHSNEVLVKNVDEAIVH